QPPDAPLLIELVLIAGTFWRIDYHVQALGIGVDGRQLLNWRHHLVASPWEQTSEQVISGLLSRFRSSWIGPGTCTGELLIRQCAWRIFERRVHQPLEADDRAPDSMRLRALELAKQYHESPTRLNELSWTLVSKPSQQPELYALALRAAERAVEVSRNGS